MTMRKTRALDLIIQRHGTIEQKSWFVKTRHKDWKHTCAEFIRIQSTISLFPVPMTYLLYFRSNVQNKDVQYNYMHEICVFNLFLSGNAYAIGVYWLY